MTCVVKIFCLNPFFVHFVLLVYVLKTMEEKIKSETEALVGPAGSLGESKDEGIVFVKPSPNTRGQQRKFKNKKYIFFILDLCRKDFLP